MEIQVIAEYNKSLTELYFLEGTILDHNRIDFMYLEK